jgi:hypothetical protein
MEFLTKDVCVKQWQVFAMVLLSGYATGAIVAKITAVGL